MKTTKRELNLAETAYCPSSTLRRVARLITSLYDSELRPAGLRATGLTILVAITKAQPSAIGALANELLLDPTTMTRSLQVLQKQGLISISRRSSHRQRFVSLEPNPVWRRAQTRLVGAIGADFWNTLERELGRIERAAIELMKAGISS
jgi:DNA-binding MarR family transcriptional regulator